MAIIISLYPAYLYTFYKLKRDTIDYPENLQLYSRIFFICLSILIASLVILFDISTLTYYLLQGDLTLPFILKVSITFIIFINLFIFFLKELRNQWSLKQFVQIASIITIIIFCCIVFGFTLVGSPYKAKLISYDKARVYALNTIQSEILSYWLAKGELPSNLDDLTNSLTGFKTPHDPQTNLPYSYQKLSDLSFELCANFNLATISKKDDILVAPYTLSPSTMAYPEPWNWQHNKGKYCFVRKIDPSLYKNKKF